ncbi:hypothetical protein [Actinomadura sp. BRA 177]|uniref:hypothetical protein n=1 Tax=Actinomadura sp. BRA 177 TaxID=2745202 RepID=UPI0020CDCA88|nr:hypothetical protein [Actinomadura sp. BRA 177]
MKVPPHKYGIERGGALRAGIAHQGMDANTRGFSTSLAAGDTCHAVMREATTTLLNRALATDTVRPDVSPETC